jgi:hypothetical protein
MPANGFSLGRDNSITINTPFGPLVPSLITNFDSKQEHVKKQSKGMDGRVRNIIFPDGWTGTLEVDRQNSNVDDFFAALEAAYYAGQNIGSSTITQTISEANGAVSQYQYVGVNFEYTDAGSWKQDDITHQKLTFTAEQRIKLA